jgi:hypothetical protein
VSKSKGGQEHELSSYTDYNKLSPLKYWRSKSNFEVDFISKEDKPQKD